MIGQKVKQAKVHQPVVTHIGTKLFASSTNIAEVFHKRHDNVLKSIANTSQKLIETGRNPALYFKGWNHLGKNGKTQPCFDLTRLGFDTLALSFNGQKAFEYKQQYILQFHTMSEALLVIEANKLNDEWNEKRSTGKEVHRLYTDTAELFLGYCKVQRGNDGYRKHFYSNLGNAKLKALFIFDVNIKPCRDLLSKSQVRAIEQADIVADNALKEGMGLGLAYKDIFQKAKQAVIELGLLIGKKHVPDSEGAENE